MFLRLHRIAPFHVSTPRQVLSLYVVLISKRLIPRIGTSSLPKVHQRFSDSFGETMTQIVQWSDTLDSQSSMRRPNETMWTSDCRFGAQRTSWRGIAVGILLRAREVSCSNVAGIVTGPASF